MVFTPDAPNNNSLDLASLINNIINEIDATTNELEEPFVDAVTNANANAINPTASQSVPHDHSLIYSDNFLNNFSQFPIYIRQHDDNFIRNQALGRGEERNTVNLVERNMHQLFVMANRKRHLETELSDLLEIKDPIGGEHGSIRALLDELDSINTILIATTAAPTTMAPPATTGTTETTTATAPAAITANEEGSDIEEESDEEESDGGYDHFDGSDDAMHSMQNLATLLGWQLGTPIGQRVNYNPDAYEDVTVSLDEKLLNKIPIEKYSKKVNDANFTECAICLDSFTEEEFVRVLPCTHIYHTDCIETWFKEHISCPVCKRDQRDLLESI